MIQESMIHYSLYWGLLQIIRLASVSNCRLRQQWANNLPAYLPTDFKVPIWIYLLFATMCCTGTTANIDLLHFSYTHALLLAGNGTAPTRMWRGRGMRSPERFLNVRFWNYTQNHQVYSVQLPSDNNFSDQLRVNGSVVARLKGTRLQMSLYKLEVYGWTETRQHALLKTHLI